MPIFAIIGAIVAGLWLIGVNVPHVVEVLWICLFLHLIIGGIGALPWVRRDPN